MSILGMVYYWLYHTVQKRGSIMQSTSCPTSIYRFSATGLLGEGFLPPAQSERLGLPEFFRWCLGGWNRLMASSMELSRPPIFFSWKMVTRNAGHFRPIVHPEVVTHPCCENGWNLLAAMSQDVLTYCGIHPPSIQTWEWCLLINGEKMVKAPMFFSR